MYIPDVVIISVASFLHNKLGVIQDESTHDDQSNVQVHFVEQLRSNEQIHKTEHEQAGQTRKQDSCKRGSLTFRQIASLTWVVH